MTATAVALATLCQFLLVGGQLLLKHATNAAAITPRRWPRVLVRFGLGVGLLAGWFFLWLGLLERFPLSLLFPFEGLSPVLLVLGARLFLKERVPFYGWVGIVLISTGVTLVAAS